MNKGNDFLPQRRRRKIKITKVGTGLFDLLEKYKKYTQGGSGRSTEYDIKRITQVFKSVEAGEITPTAARKEMEISKTHYYELLKDYKGIK